jgi:hypothetical protein
VSADPAYCRQQLPGLTRALLDGAPIDDAAFWSELAAVDHELGLDDAARAAAERAP